MQPIIILDKEGDDNDDDHHDDYDHHDGCIILFVWVLIVSGS